MDKKKPNPIDVHVGSKIRRRRTMLKISQAKLAEGLGITFQQVQKYEMGHNRVGASRLQNIATLLTVPIGYFFSEAADTALPSGGGATARVEDAVTEFLASNEGMELNLAFQKVTNTKLRQDIIQLVKSLGHTSEIVDNSADSGAT